MSSEKSEKAKPKPRPRIPKPINEDVIPHIFVDGHMIATSEYKDVISLCFLSVLDKKPFIYSRHVLTLERAKKLVESLKEAIEECEKKPSKESKMVEKAKSSNTQSFFQ